MPYRNKEQQAQYQRDWHQRNRERRLATTTQRNRTNRDKIRQYVQDLKEATPCTDCGLSYPYYVMDFDHISGLKVKGITKMVAENVSLERIKDEIAKCEVVCANCHRVRTHIRKGTGASRA